MNRILVLGDVMLDKHLRGECTRISPEAPIPVIDLIADGVSISLGAAANVAAHVVNAGIECVLAYKSYIDPPKENSHEVLKTMCSEKGILCQPLEFGNNIKHTVTIKERIWAGSQQICRVDREDRSKPDKQTEVNWIKELERIIEKFNISTVIFSDYDKGTLTDPIIQNIAHYCFHKGIPTILDPKRPLFFRLKKLTIIKPNAREVKQTNHDLFHLSDILGATYLVNTLGKDGMVVYQFGEKQFYYPSQANQEEAIDVCGCGDALAGIFGIMLYFGASIEEAVEAGSAGAAINIRYRGCYVPTPNDMKNIMPKYIL